MTGELSKVIYTKGEQRESEIRKEEIREALRVTPASTRRQPQEA